MDDDSFLSSIAAVDSTATLTVLLPDGSVSQLHNVSPLTIMDKCPLLYHSFECRDNGVHQANIEATSMSPVLSLLRFLYTGDYLSKSLQSDQESLINHAEAFKMGRDYDVPELQVAAYVNFTHATELACSFATPPTDMCLTVRFLYEHFADHTTPQERSLLDTLLHYCLSMFNHQRLAKDEEFGQVIWDLPAFHKDLCRLSMQRNFEDDGALDLVRLPVSYVTECSQTVLNKRALGDFQFELWHDSESQSTYSDSETDGGHKKRLKQDDAGSPSYTELPYRQKYLEETASMSKPVPTYDCSESEYSSDESEFTLVHRPKQDIKIASPFENPESGFSSPELVSAPSPEVVSSPGEWVEVPRDDWNLMEPPTLDLHT